LGITFRTHEAIAPLLNGRLKKEISSALSISVNTAKRHIENVYGKPGINSTPLSSALLSAGWAWYSSVVAGKSVGSGACLSVSVLSQLLRYLAHLHIDGATVLRGAGVDAWLLKHPDIPMSLEDHVPIEEEAVRLSGDPYFGFHMGEYFEPGDWSILSYVMMNCRALGEASEKAARYQNIIGSVIHAGGYLGLGKVTVVLSTPPEVPRLSRHRYDAALSSYARMMRNLSGRNLNPWRSGSPSGHRSRRLNTKGFSAVPFTSTRSEPS
jgi:hypothetical protein